VGGSVFVSGRSSSVVEIVRFQLQRFTVSMKELAERFGLDCANRGGRMLGSARKLNWRWSCELIKFDGPWKFVVI
jgi:hypothetical protein